MDCGVFVNVPSLDKLVNRARLLAAAGVQQIWVPQIFGFDVLTAFAAVTTAAPGLRLCTAVVPVYPRHPTALAAQALTVSAMSRGRLTLGVGLSHRFVTEGMLGMTWGRVDYLREYLSVLEPLLRGEQVDFAGDHLTARVPIEFMAPPVPLLVAALGPKMLAAAAELSGGTITWMTGPATLRTHIVPAMTKGAEAAGRPAPQIVAALPVAITSQCQDAYETAASVFAAYGQIPSYRAMLDREGLPGPEDLAIIGDEAHVGAAIAGLADAGVTHLVAVPFFDHERTVDGVLRLTAAV
jgi:5,10-methylenetetrahydromethanopterin reductase